MSQPLRRPIQPHEVQPMRDLGREFAALRKASGLSARQLARVGVITCRQVQRIEQGARRTRRSTLDRLVGVMLLARPDLGEQDALVERLVQTAGPALAPESPYADKSAARREAKVQRVADRRAMYAHLRD